jgi:sulfate adenylyltransferase subunit 2
VTVVTGARLSHLQYLESESIHILREAVAEFRSPVLLYSVGKDSSVLVRLSQKAFHPGPIPFPLMHIDTGYKFPEMYEFRDRFCRDIGVELLVERNEEGILKKYHPRSVGADACCRHMKTDALLNAIRKHGFDAAIGGARREEEKSRAKERVFSIRGPHGQWDPKTQRPELWELYNCKLCEGETARVFPLSNWTELDVWQYIRAEEIPVVPIYFATERPVIRRNGALIPYYANGFSGADPETERVEMCVCRFRSLGCVPCTGAVESSARTIDDIVAEVASTRTSERGNRLIDFTSDTAMEDKKKDGYF